MNPDDEAIRQAALLAQAGNLTAGMGGGAPSGLISAPTGVPDYHNSVGDSQSGYAAGPSTIDKSLAALSALGGASNAPPGSSAPAAPALMGPSGAPASLVPAYTPLGAAPQIGGIAPVQSANLGMPSAAPSLGAPSAPAPLAARGNMTQAGIAPAASFDMASAPPADNSLADVSNAGVSSVPNFQPAPGIADHAQSLAQRIAGGIHKVGGALAGLSPLDRASMSPEQQKYAGQMALRNFGTALLNRQPDARGFMPSTLQSIAQGVQAGQASGQQTLQQGEQQQQYQTQVAQARALVTGRAQLAQQYAFNPADTQKDQLRKLDGLAAGLTGLGDYHGAEAAAQAAKSLREGNASAAANSPFAQINAGDVHTVFRKADGMYLQRDGSWAPSIPVGETPFHATETWARQNTADLNASTTRENHFQSAFVKPFSKPAGAIAGWEAARAQAAPSADFPQGNPAATKATITAFVGAMEPNVQLRYATLQYLSNIDPSLAGQVKRMISTGQYGTLPPQQLAEMDAVVKQKAAAYKAQYQSTVKKGLSMYPDLAKQAPAWEDLTGQSAPAAAPSVDLSKFYTKP